MYGITDNMTESQINLANQIAEKLTGLTFFEASLVLDLAAELIQTKSIVCPSQ